MKNLKKTLSLVLAMVMVFGMFAVTANAAEVADLDEVNAKYVEAVSVVNGMGIIEGDENGVFNPTGKITRAGMAKLISYIVLGKEGAENLPKTSSAYTDVAVGEWYTGYINYCATAGYIDGNGDGTYNPDGEISGYGAAKLLLSALGYGKNGEYVGDGWEMRVAQDALNAKIFAGNIGGLSEAVPTREEVALYIYNTLQTETVNYLAVLEMYSGTETELSEVVGYGKITKDDADIGVITNNSAIDKDAFDAKTGAALTYVDGTAYTFETELEDLGTYVQVVKGVGADEGTPVYAMLTLSTKVEVAADITTAAKYKAAFGTVSANYTNDDLTYDTVVINDGYASVGSDVVDAAEIGSAAANAGTYHIYDGKFVGYVAPQSESLEQVKEIKTASEITKIYTKAGKLVYGVETKNVVGADAVAKDDVVLVAQTGDYYTVKKAETVEGQVTGVTADADKALTVINMGDKTYGATTTATDYVTLTGEKTVSDVNDKDYIKAGYTTKLYLDSNGNYITIAQVTAAAAKSDVVYLNATYDVTTVDAYNTPTTKAYAQIVKLDGTIENLLVDVWVADYDNNATNGTAVAGWDAADSNSETYYDSCTVGLYTYKAYTGTNTALKDTYVLEAASTTAHATNAWATQLAGAATLTATSNTFATDAAEKTYYDADTQFIFVEGTLGTAKATVKADKPVLKNAIADNSYAVVAYDAQKNVVAKYVIVAAKYEAAAVVSTDLIYVDNTTATGTNASGSIYKCYLNGVASELVISNAATGFWSYTVKDGVYTLDTKKDELSEGVVLNQIFGGLYGTKLTSAALADVEAADAVIIDTRTVTTKITTLEEMLAAKTAGNPVEFHAVVSGTGAAQKVAFIYIVNESAAVNGTTRYATVQAALDAAASGDTIIVLPGTYTEELAVSAKKTLTIKGAAAGGVVLKGGLTLTDNSSSVKKEVTVEGLSFEVKGLQINSYGKVTVKNNKFSKITAADAIAVDGTTTSLTITGNTIDGVTADGQYAGIRVDGVSGTTTISENVVTNVIHNAIVIINYDGGAVTGTIKVTGNSLSNWGKHATEKGRAVRAYLNGATLTISGNTMTHTAAPEEYVKVTGTGTATITGVAADKIDVTGLSA